MKILALFFWGCALVITSACAGHMAEERTGNLKILVEIRPEVNYVTHLYTLAELGFSDSAYAENMQVVMDRVVNEGEERTLL